MVALVCIDVCYLSPMEMNRVAAALAIIGAALCTAPAQAISVYRCVTAEGVISYQDTPCASNSRAQIIELADAPLTAPPPAVPAAQDAPPPATRKPQILPPAPRIRSSAILCQREDGTRYLSETGRGEHRAVPLASLGVPQRSLADAYGGRDGIGVSAPGLRQPPVDRSVHGQAGALHVWVEDPCERIRGAALCEFLDDQVVAAERRPRLAFSDTQARARNELEAARQRVAKCSR